MLKAESKEATLNTQPFNLDEIKQFDHALIYGFSPEHSMNSNDINSMDYFIFLMNQSKDIFNAYHYVEHEVIPEIEKLELKNITAEKCLTWINQIHIRIAKTLAADQKEIAGTYVDAQVLRWHYSFRCHQDLMTASQRVYIPEEIVTKWQGYGCDPQTTRDFLNLLQKHSKIQDINQPKRQAQQSTTIESIDLLSGLNELVKLYHDEKLTPNERNILAKVVIIGYPPEIIPQKMQLFADELCQKLRNCNANDIDQVTELAFFVFYNITEIHPYFNGNGRAATCMMNLVLRLLGQPSILLRLPQERNNPDSAYSIAISKINSNPELLKAHIKRRIQEAGQYQNQTLKTIVILRLEYMNCLEELVQLNKNYSFNELELKFRKKLNDVFDECEAQLKMGAQSTEVELLQTILQKDGVIVKMKDLLLLTNSDQSIEIPRLKIYVGYAKKLIQQEKQATNILPMITSAKKKYTKQEVETIKNKLKLLTGQQNIELFSTNGLTVQIYLDDKQVAKAITEQLKATQATQARCMQHKLTGKFIVKIENINLQLLNAVQSLNIVIQSMPIAVNSPLQNN